MLNSITKKLNALSFQQNQPRFDQREQRKEQGINIDQNQQGQQNTQPRMLQERRYDQRELNREALNQHFGQPRMLQEPRYVYQEPNHNPLFQKIIDLDSSSEEDEIPMLIEDRCMVR